jgi:phosphopantothenate-cysteine ligase
VIVLKKTPKVIGEIKKRSKDTVLVGFKLLTGVPKDVLIDTGYKLMQKNGCDLVLANDLTEITENKHVGYLISKNGDYERLTTKKEIAEAIVKKVELLLKEKEGSK